MTGLDFDASVDTRGVAARFRIEAGETVALLGPNGAGKSTILGVLSGLITPTAGSVFLGDRNLVGLPPHQRQIALLAQDPLLFPHMTALDNVAFGPRARGATRHESHAAAQRWLDEVGVGHLSSRKPHQLSGGQAQRVAVARALAAEPELLLLDEPMAALDVAVTPSLRQMLRTVLEKKTTVIVTHDALDALLLADRVLVIEGGAIVEEGPTPEVMNRPRSPFAAQIAGLNLVAGQWDGEHVTHLAAAVTGMTTGHAPRQGHQAIAIFSPSAVAVHTAHPDGSPRNVIAATISDIEPLGDRVRVRTTAAESLHLAAEVTPTAAAELNLAPGDQIYLAVKATEVTVYPANGAEPAGHLGDSEDDREA